MLGLMGWPLLGQTAPSVPCLVVEGVVLAVALLYSLLTARVAWHATMPASQPLQLLVEPLNTDPPPQ